MIEYPDLPFGNSVESVSAMMNQTGFTGFGSMGSVKDYFFTQTNGKVSLNSQVVKVKLPLPSASYHAQGAQGDMVGDIIDQINLQFPNGFTNLSEYPGQGGLWYFNLLTKYPGGGYAFGFGGKFIKNNGAPLEIKRGHITFFGATDQLGINTICHEAGHSVMSWTDYYRTAFCNLGDYDVMASAGTSKAPMPINPGLRLQKKWIDNVVNIPGDVTATYTLTSNSYSQIHKYTNPNNPKEYLLFHALKHGGYYQSALDGGKPLDEGLAIWYVDEDCKFDKAGVDNQYFIRLIQADNVDEMHDEFTPIQSDVRGDLNDLYDNISNTFPNNTPFRWKDGGEFGISISNISAPGATMSFTVNARPSTVIANSDENGTLSPKGTISVPTGQSKMFVFLPNPGYELDVVKVNGVPVTVTNNTFNLTSITGNRTLTASFKKKAVITPLSSPWQKIEVGTFGSAGLATQESGRFYVESYGSNIGGTTDNFGYIFQTLNGDGSIVARVASSNMASYNQRTGIMLRESLDSNAAFTMIAQYPHSGITAEMRSASGMNNVPCPSKKPSLHIYSLHNWFKITRVGNQITQSCSRDGITWVDISTENMNLGKAVYVGVISTGFFGTYPSKAIYDSVVVTTTNPSPVVNITSPLNNSVISDSSAITITANASDSNGNITKVDFYNGTQLLGTDTTAPYSFVWTNVGGGKYNILAKATDNQGAVTTSIPVKIKVPCVFSTPKLTGTVIGTTGSWNNGGNTRDKAFDGDTNTYFDAPTDIAWTGLSLDKTYNITGINFFPRKEFTGRMIGGKFQGSNTADFSSGVEDLATITIEPTLEWNCITVNNNSSYKYVRYICASGGIGNVAEIEFYGKEMVAPSGVTVWFKKPANTQVPRIHYWNVVPAQTSSSWPGVLMTQDLTKGTDWYKFTLPTATSTNLLFHDNAGYKTADLLNISGGCFDGSTKTWINCDQDDAPLLTVSPAGGNFTSPITVTLTATDDKDPNPIIYYNLDDSGNFPSNLSFVKTGTITISTPTTLRVITKDSKDHVSIPQTFKYTFNQVTGVTVWFKKPANTQAPRIHYWNAVPTQASSTWPGELMTQDISKGADWYKFTIANASSSNMLFHDNAGYKTADLTNITGGCFDGNTKTWINCNQENIPVQSVSVNPVSMSMAIGVTQAIATSISPSNATNKNITWSSSNTAVATVSTSGVVTAVAIGNATITATTVDGSFTATTAITVTAQKTITIYVVKRQDLAVPKIHVWKNETGTDVPITIDKEWPKQLPDMIRADGSSTRWFKYTVTANRIGALFRYGTTQSPDVKYYTEDVFVVLNSDGTIRKIGASLEEVSNEVHNKSTVETADTSEKALIVSPNPASESVNINYQGTKSSKVDLVIYDMLGNFVYSQTENVTDGNFFKTIDTYNFRSGIYIVSINDGTQVLNQKLIIR